MRRYTKSLVLTIILAIVIHFALVASLPNIVMGIALKRIEKTALKVAQARGIDVKNLKIENRILHAPPRTADTREVVAPNPDLLFSVVLYDVRERPLFISAPVPDSYWSISFYASNTVNFFIKGSKNTRSNPVRLLLVSKHSDYSTPNNIEMVKAASDKGIILFRYLIKNKIHLKDLDKLRKKTVVKSVELSG